MTKWKRQILGAALGAVLCVVSAGCEASESAPGNQTEPAAETTASAAETNSAVNETDALTVEASTTTIKSEQPVTEVEEEYENPLFHQGLLVVQLDWKWGYIDESGKFVINPQFKAAENFNSKGLALVSIPGTYHNAVIDTEGETVIDYIDMAIDYWNGIFKINGDGLAIAEIEGKYGYVNKMYEWVIEPQFDVVWDFDENGLAVVKQNGKWGFIDTSGNYVIEPQFDDVIFGFSGGSTAYVELDGIRRYIDLNGRFINEPQLDEFHLKNFQIERAGELENLVSAEGEIIFTADHIVYYSDEIYQFEVYEFYNLDDDDYYSDGSPDYHSPSYIIIDKEGTDFTVDWIGPEENGMVEIMVDDKRGYLDEWGHCTIEPQYYIACDFDENGYARVALGGVGNEQWGIIDKNGNYVLYPQFKTISDFFRGGLAAVQLNDKWGWVDMEGNYVLNPQFDRISGFTDNGRSSVLLNGKWGYIDIVSGEWIVEPIYEENFCQFYDDGYAVLSKDGSLCGIGDYEGNYIINPQFNYVNKANTFAYRWYHLE